MSEKRLIWKKSGLCSNCGGEVMPGYKCCQECISRAKERYYAKHPRCAPRTRTKVILEPLEIAVVNAACDFVECIQARRATRLHAEELFRAVAAYQKSVDSAVKSHSTKGALLTSEIAGEARLASPVVSGDSCR